MILSHRNIFRRDNHQCAYCGKKGGNLTIDHVIPKSKGGNDSWENLITACVKCNNHKGNLTPEEAEMELLFVPYKPNRIIFLANTVNKMEEVWKPYLFQS